MKPESERAGSKINEGLSVGEGCDHIRSENTRTVSWGKWIEKGASVDARHVRGVPKRC